MPEWTGKNGPFHDSINLNLDLPGILFTEALKRIKEATSQFTELDEALDKHAKRLAARNAEVGDEMSREDAEVDMIQGIGGLEPACGALVAKIALIDIGLAAAGEAYINAVAEHVLSGKEADHFDKLSPTAKWLFLPRVMGLKWEPKLGAEPLQGYSELVARRNRWLHPKVVKTSDIFEIHTFLVKCGLDLPACNRGAESVRGLIEGLSLDWRGAYGPDWLFPESDYYYEPCFYIGDISASGRFGRPIDRG